MTDRIRAWVKVYDMTPGAEGMTLSGPPAE
jgi:hypothetical protein